ncbi:MAG: asparagine synthase (glutamine-hydrolyzing) [Ignavibacteriae bacterium]|nr:asparagine synthase (glutamine-hydrolyzing) [Ignavibacteriota bacterium]
MCGIVGIYYFDKSRKVEFNDLKLMTDSLIHRGPDDEGHYLDLNVGLGFRRLSIIDLTDAGHQPMTDDAESVWIVFNGEIYNFKELRKELEKDGIVFKSNSDTEVLIYGYKKYGINIVKKIEGFFAFCIYDLKNKKIYLARDKVGKKPLYYIKNDKGLYFASEIKAFKHLGFNFEINERLFNDCMYYRFSENLSIFNNVSYLGNGEYIEIDLQNKSFQKNIYFTYDSLLDEQKYAENACLSENELIMKFDELMRKAVNKRLISDAKVGTTNSGGVDSSLVSALSLIYEDIDLFFIDVESMSEKYYAELLAHKLNKELISRKINVDLISDNIDNVINHYEFPLVHPNAFGISELAKLANVNDVKVLLAGEAADELFGGYGHYRKFYISRKYRKYIPKRLVTAIFNKSNSLLKFFASEADYLAYRNDIFSEESMKIHERYRKNLIKYEFIKNIEEREVQSVLLSDLSQYLQPLLLRADKMGMMNSVEFRLPFMDIDVIQFALNLPLKYKVNRLHGKYIVKKLAEKYIDKENIYRSKIGFSHPIPKKCKLLKNISDDRNYVYYSYIYLKNIYN